MRNRLCLAFLLIATQMVVGGCAGYGNTTRPTDIFIYNDKNNNNDVEQTDFLEIANTAYETYRDEILNDEFNNARNAIIQEYARVRLGEKFAGENPSKFVEDLSGHESLLIRSIDDILKERRLLEQIKLGQAVYPEDPPEGTHELCVKAYHQKVKWHRSEGKESGLDPELQLAFGKITVYTLTPYDSTKEIWSGVSRVCSWYGQKNFLFNINFPLAKGGGLTLVGHDDADSALSPELVEQFRDKYNYKLHAIRHQIEYTEVYEDGVLLDPSDDFFKNKDEPQCFDLFLKHHPTGNAKRDIHNQNNYCLGRCGAMLNTGK